MKKPPQFNPALLLFTVLVFAYFSPTYPQTIGEPESLYHIRLFAVDMIDILDSKGSVLQPLSPFVSVVLRDVHYERGTEVDEAAEELATYPNRALLWAAHDIWFETKSANHEIRFRTTSSPMMHFEIMKGSGLNQEDADVLIRYVDPKDLRIPAGVDARIKFTSTAISDLQLDMDKNGTYETLIKPQFRVTGLYAKDESLPRVTMTASITGNIATITVSATDTGSGIKEIRYQINNGNPSHPRYTGPFRVDITGEVTVFALVDDFAGNRGMEFKIFEFGKEKVGADPYNVRQGDPFKITSAPSSTGYPAGDPFQLKSKPY